MASARLKITVYDKEYNLYFGMSSTRIFQELSAKDYQLLVDSGIEKPTLDDIDHYKSFANLIHSGLCNMADINSEQRPLFIDSYSLAELISKDDELCLLINDVWSNSQPVKDMLDKLASFNVGEKKNKVKNKTTGKK